MVGGRGVGDGERGAMRPAPVPMPAGPGRRPGEGRRRSNAAQDERIESAVKIVHFEIEPPIRAEAAPICPIYREERDRRGLVANRVLRRMKNVIVTPLSAFDMREAVRRMAEMTVENIRAFAGSRARNMIAIPVAAGSGGTA